MSDEPEAEEGQPSAVVPFEEPQVDAKPVPPTSVLRLPMGRKGPQLLTIDDALKYATACHRSGLLPWHIKSPQQAYVIMDNGRELGLSPWAAWKLIYVTKQGRIAIMSKGALAVAQASPHFEAYKERIELEGTEEMRAIAIAKRRGMEPVIKTFSMEDAKTADLLSKKRDRRGDEYDGPWQAYVKDMLLARARDRALAIAFAAELAGIELETIADDADRLAAAAAGAPVTVVGPPKVVDDVPLDAAPPVKELPAPRPDPLLAFVMKGQRAEVAAAKAATEIPKAKSMGAEPAPGRSTGAPVDSAPISLKAEIDASVEEAFPRRQPAERPTPPPEPPPPKKRAKRDEIKRHAVGDIIRDVTRRVTEVDEQGRIVEVERLSAETVAALKKDEPPAKPTQKVDPTRPPYPAHVDDGVWYCDAHNAYGCPTCATAAREAAEKPKRCPREHCGAPLNLLGDCDNCGWPSANYQ